MAAWARPRLLALGQAKAASWPGSQAVPPSVSPNPFGTSMAMARVGSPPAAWLIVAVSALGVLCADGSMVTLSWGA